MEGLRDGEQPEEAVETVSVEDNPLAALFAKVTSVNANEPDNDPFYLWPECARAWDEFGNLLDQWRDGSLPRSEILAHLGEVAPDAEERRDLYADICVLSREVARVRAEHQGKKLREREAARKKVTDGHRD